MVQSITVGGIRTACATRIKLAEEMVQDCLAARAGDVQSPRLVFYSNGYVISLYHRSRDFRALMDEADIISPDGMPLVLTTRRLLSTPLPERIATTDFIFEAADAAMRAGLRFYFLGSRPENNSRAAAYFRDRFPSLDIVGSHHGFFDVDEEPRICADIREKGVDVLWVGLGNIRQESFAVRNRERLAGTGWIHACGGLFDHYAGQLRRAPDWMQQCGLEWVHRTAQEPRRLATRYFFTNLSAAYHLVTKTHAAPNCRAAR